MMRRFLWLLLVILLGLGAALGLHYVPGYVLVQIKGTSVALPLWLALIAIVVFLFVVFLLGHIIRSLIHIPAELRGYGFRRRLRKQHQAAELALNHYLIRDWLQAERHLAKAAKLGFLPEQMRLLAARCAFHRGAVDKQLDWLHQVVDGLKPSKDTVYFAVAEVDQMIIEQKWDIALQRAEHWLSEFPKNPWLTQRLVRIGCESQNWAVVKPHLTIFLKDKSLTDERKRSLLSKAYAGLIRQSPANDEKALKRQWSEVPNEYRYEPNLLVQLVAQHSTSPWVQQQIVKALNQHWSDDVFLLFAENVNMDPAKQLSQAEGWLKSREATALNQYVMAKLCLRNQLADRAEHYLERSLAIQTSRQAYQLLGETQWQQQKPALAIKSFQSACVVNQDIH